MKRPRNKALDGFTLVEMAIVLVIIGIILAGVMKGRDIVRGSQIKQFSQQFAQKWGTIAQTYYDKTGKMLNDGAENGGTTGATADGEMDGDLGDHINITGGVVEQLKRVGINPCTLIKSKLNAAGTTVVTGTTAPVSCANSNIGVNLVQTQVEGEYTGVVNTQVDLVSLKLTNFSTTSTAGYTRNFVVLYRVPTDVAIGLDTSIDGTENGASGAVLNLGRVLSSALGTGATLLTEGQTLDMTGTGLGAWPAASDGGAQIVGIVLDF